MEWWLRCLCGHCDDEAEEASERVGKSLGASLGETQVRKEKKREGEFVKKVRPELSHEQDDAEKKREQE